MTLLSDERAKAAVELLTIRLNREFDQAVANCLKEIQKYPYPLVAHGYDWAPIFSAVIVPWRQKSLDHVSEVFKKLFNVENILEGGDVAAAKAAKRLCWRAINKAFSWTVANKTNSAKFAEWLKRCHLVIALVDDDVHMIAAKCNEKGAPLVERLTCDFRTQFENLLKDLSLNAALSGDRSTDNRAPLNIAATTVIPREVNNVASTGQTTATNEKEDQSDSMQPPYWSDALEVKNSRMSTPARGKLVKDIKRELERYEDKLVSLPKYSEDLARRHTECIAFDIYSRYKDRRDLFDACIRDGRYSELAFEMAAAVTRGAVEKDAMKAAWIKFKRREKSR